MGSLLFWIGFHLFLVLMIYVDLYLLHRKSSRMTLKSIVSWCFFWVGLALAFNALIGWNLGKEQAFAFFTAYFLEMSLSVDNLFVFIMLFSFCGIAPRAQRKILYLGILGALVLRLLFIVLGITLLHYFSWMYFVFGAILCFSAFCFFQKKEDFKDSLLVKIAEKLFRIDHQKHDGRFFVKKKGKRYVTMSFLALFLIEGSDLLFAIDSVPAVLAVTSDFFLAYTSNVFAILGLRSLYFLLVKLQERFCYLRNAIPVILFFVGLKLLLIPFFSVPTWVTLSVIVVALTVAVMCSFQGSKRHLN